MKPGLTVTGVMSVGTALVFGAAILVSALFPNGTRIAGSWNGGTVWAKDGMVVMGPAPMAVPAPIPVPVAGGGSIDLPAPDVVVSK